MRYMTLHVQQTANLDANVCIHVEHFVKFACCLADKEGEGGNSISLANVEHFFSDEYGRQLEITIPTKKNPYLF